MILYAVLLRTLSQLQDEVDDQFDTDKDKSSDPPFGPIWESVERSGREVHSLKQ